MPLNSLSWRIAVPLAVGALVALAGCAPSVEVSAAKDSNNPACAPMMVALPDSLADAARRTTSSQATAAWGNPSQIILRCGVPPLGPTTDPCATVNGVDWVLQQGDPVWTLTSYGRDPAVQVLLDPKKTPDRTVLAQLSSAVSKLPQVRSCVGPGDVAPAATPSAASTAPSGTAPTSTAPAKG